MCLIKAKYEIPQLLGPHTRNLLDYKKLRKLIPLKLRMIFYEQVGSE